MKRNEAFPTGFFKAADLEENELTLHIKDVQMKSIGQGENAQMKPHVAFSDDARELALNVTNWNNIELAYGDDSDHWAGSPITLYKDRVPYGSKIVDAIRVRVPNPHDAYRPNQAALAASTPTSVERSPEPQTPPMTAATRDQIIAQARILWVQDASQHLGEYLAPRSLGTLDEGAAKAVLAELQRKTCEAQAQAAPVADDFDDADPFGDI